MNKMYYYYYSRNNRFSTWLTILLSIAAIAAFLILALPIFLAALVVFGAIGSYIAYKIKKTVEEVEKKHFQHLNQDAFMADDDDEIIIDIVPDEEDSDCSPPNITPYKKL